MQKALMIGAALLLAGCKLGGSASGLEQPVELQDTVSQQTLQVTQDGPFTFGQTYAAGTGYNVVVSNANGQRCTVSNGAGTFARAPVTNLLVQCESDTTVCTTDYSPVCAKAPATIACVTTPCPDHSYQTFSNACTAGAASARISFDGSCDNLEETPGFDDAPVRMLPQLGTHPDAKPFTLLAARIEADVAILTLQYSGGCGEHNVNLLVDQNLVAGAPVVANTRIEHLSDDNCDALITREHRFDLLPVRAFFERQFDQSSGRVAVQNVGNYSF